MAVRKGQEDSTLKATSEGYVLGLWMLTLHEPVSALNHDSGMVFSAKALL